MPLEDRKYNKIISKYKDLPVPAKASLWFVICNILQKGISFITVPIFTRIMTTDQYGVYSTFVSWYGILIIFTSLSLYYGVFNNAMVKYPERRDQYISSMQGLCLVLTTALLIIYLVIRNFANALLNMSTPLVLLIFLKLYFAPSVEFWLIRNRFEFKYKKVVFFSLAQAFLGAIVGIIAVISAEDKAFARIFSLVIVDTIFCLAIFAIQLYKGKRLYVKDFWKYAFLFNLPLIPHYLSGTILSQGDRVMIASYCGDSAVAFYSVAYNIGILMNIIINAINASVTPWMYEKMKSHEEGKIKGIINLLCVGMLVIVTLLILFAPEMLYVLAAKEYAEAVYVIPPVAASTFFTFMYNIFANIEFYYGERKYVSIGSITAAVLNIILNAVFIPQFGYYAAAYTTLFCYMVYGLSHLWFSRYVLKQNNIESCVFDKKTILAMSLLSIAITIVFSVLYGNMIIRYLFIAIILVVVFLFRERFKQVMKIIRSK